MAQEVLEKCLDSGNTEWNVMKGKIKDTLTNHIYSITKRKPMILPIIMDV